MASLVGNFTTNNDGAVRSGGALQRRPSQTGHRASISNYLSSPFGGNVQQEATQEEETLEYFPPQEERTEQVHELARQLTRQSISSSTDGAPGGRFGALRRTTTGGSISGNPWDYKEGSDMDPYSESFNARKWTRAVISQERGDDHIPRYAGISFKNMSVHGFGSDAGE